MPENADSAPPGNPPTLVGANELLRHVGEDVGPFIGNGAITDFERRFVAGAERVLRPRLRVVLVDHVDDRVGQNVSGGAFAESSVQCHKDFFASLEGHPQA